MYNVIVNLKNYSCKTPSSIHGNTVQCQHIDGNNAQKNTNTQQHLTVWNHMAWLCYFEPPLHMVDNFIYVEHTE